MTRPDASDFFAVASVAYRATVASPSDGDLWPTAWADDDGLYTACGDGLGFSDSGWSDIVVSRIDGRPETGLTGERLASGRDIAPVWTDSDRYNSKPTGMVAVDGDGDGMDELYLAVQDLRCGHSPDTFNHAPAAGIVRSSDRGRTWSAGEGLMFSELFTTIMFLDLGRSQTGAAALRKLVPSSAPDPAGFVYAYGLDHNWRASISGVVPDPVDLFLARVPVSSVQRRQDWRFFVGCDEDGTPRWSSDIAERRPVLTDTRRRYTPDEVLPSVAAVNRTVIGQGGIVHIPAFDRFVYTSWSEFTFEFYEAPTPWGPWRHFLSQDFGPQPWVGPKADIGQHGGYAPTIPSKFISPDGRDAWVQSNWFGGAATYTGNSYHFSLRPLRLVPSAVADAASRDLRTDTSVNLARQPGTIPIASSVRCGHLEVLNDGRTDLAEDSWNGCRGEHHWGYTWERPVRLFRIVYVTGPFDCTGGWFDRPPRIQVRRGALWVDVDDLTIGPEYPCDHTATGGKRFSFTFRPTMSDGVRLVGTVGRDGGHRTSIAELEVYGG